MEYKFEMAGRKVTAYYPEIEQKCIYVYTHQEKHDFPSPFSNVVFVYIENNDYESDFTPYTHPPVFKGGLDFKGNADQYLTLLLRIMQKVESENRFPVIKRILAGYSLGGLFSLFATSKTNLFSGICCASASFWYPKFVDYVETHDFFFEKAYFSIGDKESHTKNPYLRNAYQDMMMVKQILETKKHLVYFEFNQGGHFSNPMKRVDKGVSFLLNEPCMHFDDEREKNDK